MKKNIDYVGKVMPKGDTDGDRVAEITNGDVMVYSKLLQKPFNSLEELKKAEDEYRIKHEAELKLQEEKKADAKKVEDAYHAVIEARKQAAEIIRKAEQEYISAKNMFIDKHKCFHMTYRNVDGKEFVSFSDVIDHMIDNIFKF